MSENFRYFLCFKVRKYKIGTTFIPCTNIFCLIKEMVNKLDEMVAALEPLEVAMDASVECPTNGVIFDHGE